VNDWIEGGIMIKPHGGKLVSRIGSIKDREDAGELPTIEASREVAVDIENIAHGLYSPLQGFMMEEELTSVIERGRLPNDLPWTIPIVLDTTKEQLVNEEITEGDSVAILHHGVIAGVIEIEDIYSYGKKEYCKSVFGTDDMAHPGVASVFKRGDIFIGGKIKFLRSVDERFSRYDYKPTQTREYFRKNGWKYVVGFQTRNAPHVGHECVQKTALESLKIQTNERTGLFINPVIGKKKKGDFRDDVIIQAYEVLIREYFPPNLVLLGIWKTEMRYAGPKEAIFHAIVRKNFGCTHFIVGRDHAGVGDYYSPYAAHEIFREYPDLEIQPVFVRSFNYCKKCFGVVSELVCPHSQNFKFSGTLIREMIMSKKKPPGEIMRPEVAESILQFDNPFVEG
jgi:sulfate adenylyltransferase